MGKKEILFSQDIDKLLDSEIIKWKKIANKSFLITGATGIIGYALICLLLKANRAHDLNIHIVALTRNLSKALTVFGSIVEYENNDVLTFVEGDVVLPLKIDKVDYVVHGAAITSSKEFVTRPVETINTALSGTRNVMSFCKEKKIERVVYLSTMEVYGYPDKGHKVSENETGAFDPMSVRNSYPIGKLAGEMICKSYYSEYGVSVNILRLSQTFGPNVNDNDNRLFAYFMKCIMNRENIVLKSQGKTERSYLYSLDAATAILMALIASNDGEIFNVTDESTYCSVFDFAQRISAKYGVGLKIEEDGDKQNGFADTLYMDLDTSKIRSYGWSTLMLDIEEIYDRMI